MLPTTASGAATTTAPSLFLVLFDSSKRTNPSMFSDRNIQGWDYFSHKIKPVPFSGIACRQLPSSFSVARFGSWNKRRHIILLIVPYPPPSPRTSPTHHFSCCSLPCQSTNVARQGEVEAIQELVEKNCAGRRSRRSASNLQQTRTCSKLFGSCNGAPHKQKVAIALHCITLELTR